MTRCLRVYIAVSSVLLTFPRGNLSSFRSGLPIDSGWIMQKIAVASLAVFHGLTSLTKKELLRTVLFGTGMFIIGGTVTALWQNPFFVRMTPAAGYEMTLLVLESILAGVYFGMKSTGCSIRTAGTGGVLGLLGVACPVCNKVLMLIFGSTLLMTYFEPIRPVVGLLGVVLLAAALWWKLQLRVSICPENAVYP